MKYTEFELVDFANYVLNNRRMSSPTISTTKNNYKKIIFTNPQNFTKNGDWWKNDILDLIYNIKKK